MLYVKSLLAFLAVTQVFAFPSGAGGCEEGNALGGFHLSRPQTSGDLAMGGYEMLLNDVPLSTSGAGQFPHGDSNTITLRSMDASNIFRGYLFRLDVGNGETMSLIPDEEGQIANVCVTQNVSSATHTNNVNKTEVTATIDVDDTNVNVMSLQVTVVVANAQGNSEWYVEVYQLQQTVEAEPPTSPPNPGFNPCNVCGSENRVTIPEGLVSFPDQPIFTCATVQQAGDEGFIDEFLCPSVIAFLDDCGCASTVTAAPITPVPTTPSAITSAPTPRIPTASPIFPDTPAPTAFCGSVGDDCLNGADCCSRACKKLPARSLGVCISMKTANKNAQKISAGRGGAGNRGKR